MSFDALLRDLGCESIEATKVRFLDDVDFYYEIIGVMLGDPGFELLGGQLRSRASADAFETAHMLKGIIANCGITPMYVRIEKVVEPLRRARAEYPAILDDYALLMESRSAAQKVVTVYAGK